MPKKHKKKTTPLRQKKKEIQKRPIPLALIGAVIIFIISFIIRIYSLESPIMGDEATYFVLGKKAIMGYRPYIDYYEMKPPLLFYSYGIGTLLYGFSSLGLRMIAFSLALLNSIMIGTIAKKFSSTGFAALIGSVCFFLSNNAYSYGIEGVAEHFVVFYTLIGINILFYPFIKNFSLRFIIAGAFIASSALVKQTGALFGIATAIWLILDGFFYQYLIEKKQIFKSLILLVIGAVSAVIIWFIPVIIGGGLSESIYWLIDFTKVYTSQISFQEGVLYQITFGYRIFSYQPFVISLCLMSLFTLLYQWKSKYFIPFLLLTIISYLNVYPGMRFYGQYWIPLLVFLPLLLIPLKDTIKQVKFHYLAPLLIILAFGSDMMLRHTHYFEKGYLLNAEKSHTGNYPSVMQEMIKSVKDRIQPGETFLMLGSNPEAYVELGQMTKAKHIYPRLIARDNPRNKVFQEEFFNHLKNGNYDYVIFSVTSLAWGSSSNFDQTLYQRSFNYVYNYYRPILAFNYDDFRFYNADAGEDIDMYKPNQVIMLRKR